MTTIQSILPMTRDAVAALSTSKQEPEWLANQRIAALELAGKLELPKLEKTNINRWTMDRYGQYKPEAPMSAVTELPEQWQALLEEGNQDHLIVQRNSSVVYHNLSAQLAEQGVIFMGLDEAIRQHPELIQPYFMTAVKKDTDAVTASHAAVWSDGVFLYVPKNVEVSVPLQALFYVDDAGALFSPHILIVAEDNSSVTYIDHILSRDITEHLVHNSIVEIFAGPGAKVRYTSIHDLDDKITSLTYRRAVLSNDAQINWTIGEMSGGNTMSDTNAILDGNGSNSEANVICVGSGEQQLSITTRCTHIGRNTTSDMQTRAVMQDRARGIFNGITKMEKGSTNANGEQTERILMLSPDARGDANPILLIDEDDVLAGHAASAGQVDQLQLYYLMSRGISKELAVRLVVYGFLAPVINSVPSERLEEHFRHLVQRKLAQ